MKVGDVVKLGNTKMTVENLVGDQTECVWFVGRTLYRETFRTKMLTPS